MSTITEIKGKLLTDPNFGISYIIGNNPDAVAKNLRGMDFAIGTTDDIYEAINTLIASGDYAQAEAALSVPMLIDEVDPAEVTAATEAASGLAPRPTAKTKSALGASGEGGTWWNVANVFAGLAGSYLATLQGKGGGVVTPVDTPTPSNPPKKEATVWPWVLAGGAILGLVIWAVVKGKK